MVCGEVRGNAAAVTGAVLTLRVALVFVLFLVLLVATVALGVVGLGLARAATVLALLDRTTLGVDVVQFAVCGGESLASRSCMTAGTHARASRRTMVCASAHTVALDAGLACVFLAIDNRHAGECTADCGRRSGRAVCRSR